MIGLDNIAYFIGMEFVKVKEGMVMHQHNNVRELIDMFKMINCNIYSHTTI